MKILTFSTLFPNAAQPRHGIFVETRLRKLLESGRAEARVVAPVPWFPFDNPSFGRYATFARTPRDEMRYGIEVLHPRYPVLPGIGMSLSPLLLARAVRPVFERILHEGYRFELIDAHYFYPDGVAAAMIGKALDTPVLITARGSDLNLIARYRLPRRMMQWAARQAAGIITVSAALKEVLIDMGVPPDHIEVLRNGVDLRLFYPIDRAARRAELGLTCRALLTVGNLIPLKGHDLVIRALTLLPDVELLIAGSGPEERHLRDIAVSAGVAARVRFLGTLTQPELRDHYGAVDALVLASSHEGWANVLLESMACGTPVIATAAGGTPEVVSSPEAGILVNERSPASLAQATRQLFDRYPDHAATRRYAERFDWSDTTAGQLRLFERATRRAREV